MPTISSIGVLAVVIILVYKEFKSGSSELRKQINEDYKERNNQLEERIAVLESEHHEHSIQIGKLEAVLSEKDKQLAEYKALFASQNPNNINAVLSEIAEFMRSLHKQTQYQTKILEKGVDRNQKIDKASKLHVGEPVLVPVDPLPTGDNIK